MLTFDPKQMETNLNQLLEDEGGGSGATTGVGGRDICRETSVGKSGQRRKREKETQRNRSSDVLQARAQRSSYVARNSFVHGIRSSMTYREFIPLSPTNLLEKKRKGNGLPYFRNPIAFPSSDSSSHGIIFADHICC